MVIQCNGPVDCIYTNKQFSIGDYVVEHFIPYAFVSHDPLWKLILADKSFNSSKCDKFSCLSIL
ncbi:HNH endonuclease domain-containing protein [Pedobacter nyackensis]|uniref:HNH endonuclease domain-containing protein n=1 Tax=Pedobacter nyackensis TaxID=475255 RepID=UPI003977D783